jgi:hypothetical protein
LGDIGSERGERERGGSEGGENKPGTEEGREVVLRAVQHCARTGLTLAKLAYISSRTLRDCAQTLRD